jgi:hypothetical protein
MKLARSAVSRATTIVEDSNAANRLVPMPRIRAAPPTTSRVAVNAAFAAGAGRPRLAKNSTVS